MSRGILVSPAEAEVLRLALAYWMQEPLHGPCNSTSELMTAQLFLARLDCHQPPKPEDPKEGS